MTIIDRIAVLWAPAKNLSNAEIVQSAIDYGSAVFQMYIGDDKFMFLKLGEKSTYTNWVARYATLILSENDPRSTSHMESKDRIQYMKHIQEERKHMENHLIHYNQNLKSSKSE